MGERQGKLGGLAQRLPSLALLFLVGERCECGRWRCARRSRRRRVRKASATVELKKERRGMHETIFLKTRKFSIIILLRASYPRAHEPTSPRALTHEPGVCLGLCSGLRLPCAGFLLAPPSQSLTRAEPSSHSFMSSSGTGPTRKLGSQVQVLSQACSLSDLRIAVT